MTPDRSRQIRTLVDSTFDLSLKELRSFLDRECAGDPALRAEVERMLLERETGTAPHARPSVQGRALAAGDVIVDRYRITRQIGRGGMGEVYEADDLLMKEPVAIKTLRADLAADNALVERFQREIFLARKVTHPNVCRIYEVGIVPSVRHSHGDAPFGDAGSPLLFFAMELLEGETLSARIRSGPLTRSEAFPIARQLADGLQAAHQAGIVHADFKSGNVILVPAPEGVRAVITDFGVARLDPARMPVDDSRTLSEQAGLAGTLGYMSPEQLAGEDISAASDIYSFGIVLYEMAAGRLPFDERELLHSAVLRTRGEIASIRSRVPNIDPRWETAIARCLQRDPNRRFSSAGALADWFSQGSWRTPTYWTRHDWIRNSIAACAVVAAVALGWTWSHRPYAPPASALAAYQKGLDALHAMDYETARQALQQAVAADPKFALAHASLARAYNELDYTDRAKDSMLRAISAAQESRLTDHDERALRAMQFVVSRDYERAAPLYRQIEATASAREAPVAALESGWLAQQTEDTEGATAAYERALKFDPSYAAAKLRLGFMFGRRAGMDDRALDSFTEAERLFAAAGDYEGLTQTLLERANLLDRRSREEEAMPVIERALEMAGRVGNRYQEVRLRLIQGNVLRDQRDTTRAAAVVRQAIDMATAENMDNLATTGLIDLGNISLTLGELDTAEPLFRKALDMAQRGKVPRIEARAQLSLGSLCEADHRPAEARKFVETGLSFYRAAGYRRESVQAAIVLGGVLRQLGENDEGIAVLRGAMPDAVRLQDRRVEAQLHERLADSLYDRGEWPAALEEYRRTIALFGTLGAGEFARVRSAGLLWRLGLREEAERSLMMAQQFEAKSHEPGLWSSITAAHADIAYADGRLNEADALARRALPDAADGLRRRLTLLRALVRIRLGRVDEGMQSATDVVHTLEQAGLVGETASARLSIAEALAAREATSPLLTVTQETLDYFEPKGIWESVFRGHLAAARMSRERASVDAHYIAARAALDRLKTTWTETTVKSYLARPDITRLTRGIRLQQ